MNSHSGFLAAAGLLLAVSTSAFAQAPTSAPFYSSLESSSHRASVELSSPSKNETNVRNQSASEPHETVLRENHRHQTDQAVRPDVTNMISGQNQKPVATPFAPASSGPRVDAARAGIMVHVENPTTAAVAPVAPPPRVGQNVALMVVGGAALITGAVIGGDGGTLLAIGGAVVGLIGLYQYIK